MDQVCPLLQVVFVMDTSGSMVDQGESLCSAIGGVVDALHAQGISIEPHFFGVTEHPIGVFPCLTSDVVSAFGSMVPGRPGSCSFPNDLSARESWGPATAIVAQRFPWTKGSVRVIVPMGDEGPCNGNRPGGCNDPGDDRDAIANAIEIAMTRGVIVSPIVGTGSDGCTMDLAQELAEATGGLALVSEHPKIELAEVLKRILSTACESVGPCDDLNACTVNDQCVEGVCLGTAMAGCIACQDVADCDDSNACTTESCEIGVCGFVETPGCEPCVSQADCNDGDACTRDVCTAGSCDHSLNHVPSVHCCDPELGSLALLDDENPCTFDLCNVKTGMVLHPPVPQEEPCNDNQICTVEDACDGAGNCVGKDLESIACDADDDCGAGVCNSQTRFCECGKLPLLRLRVLSPTRGQGECYVTGDDITVLVEMGFSQVPIHGAQFLIPFDPTRFSFVDAVPGHEFDALSPFTQEFFEILEPVAGSIFQGVGVSFGQSGARGPVVLSVLTFRLRSACTTDELCLAGGSGAPMTMLTDATGRTVPFETQCTGDLRVDDGPSILTCPESYSLLADAGEVTAFVQWSPVSVRDGCEEPIVSCTARHELGVAVDHLLPSGGRFPQGRSDFECETTDTCGVTSACAWFVEVQDANEAEVSVQLSPAMAAGTLNRCIEFEFFDNCVEGPSVVRKVLRFGPPFDLAGRASGVTLHVPPGRYQCVTARDPLHTVRAVADIDIVDNRFVAMFEDDPFFDGNWLVGGNLNGDHVVDILDFGIFANQYLTRRPRDTDCGASARHADINGDGIVDQFDWSFVLRNYLAHDKNSCCPEETASAAAAMTRVSVAQLSRMGFEELVGADLNHDGWVDESDMAAFNEGLRPVKALRPAQTSPSQE